MRVDGAVDKVVELSIKDLRENYEQVEVISSLQVSLSPTLLPVPVQTKIMSGRRNWRNDKILIPVKIVCWKSTAHDANGV